MAFLIPHDPLTPRHRLQARIAPGTRVLRAAQIGAWGQAEDLIASARAQAQAMVADARAVCERERERGRAEGLAQAQREQAERMLETVARTAEYFARVEADMVALVMAAVRKIIDDYGDADRVLIVVRNALSVMRGQNRMTLRLHPQQVEVVRARIDDLLCACPGRVSLDLLADGRLDPQACILESEIGRVEASIEGQLAALGKAFENVLGRSV